MSKWWFMRSSTAEGADPWLTLEPPNLELLEDKPGRVVQISLLHSSDSHTHQAVYLGIENGKQLIIHFIKPLLNTSTGVMKQDIRSLPAGTKFRITEVDVFPKKTRLSLGEIKEKLFQVAADLEKMKQAVEANCSCHMFVELYMKRCFFVGFRRCAFEPGDLITINQPLHPEGTHPHKAIYLGAFNGEELIVHGAYQLTNSDCRLKGNQVIPSAKKLTLKVDKLYDVAKDFEVTGTGTCVVNKSPSASQDKTGVMEALMKKTLELNAMEVPHNGPSTCADFVVYFLDLCGFAIGKKSGEPRTRNTTGSSQEHVNIDGGFSTQVEWSAGATALAVLGAVLGVAVKILRR